MPSPLLVGAVAYSPNVVPIWEGMAAYFAEGPAPMDFVLFSGYARQVEALLDGTIDIAWNTNLAWLRTSMRTDGTARALAMRDTDLAFQTMIVAQAGAGLEGLEKLRGRRLALGSRDSAQAAILPVHYLSEAGLAGEVDLLRIEADLGKHGDTGRSELDALRAVLDGDADAAALGSNTWAALATGDLMAGAFELVWESPQYCHCNFTALPNLDIERSGAWVEHLLAMDWDNPAHRPILELEGLRRWVAPSLEGYESLIAAVREQGISARW